MMETVFPVIIIAVPGMFCTRPWPWQAVQPTPWLHFIWPASLELVGVLCKSNVAFFKAITFQTKESNRDYNRSY